MPFPTPHSILFEYASSNKGTSTIHGHHVANGPTAEYFDNIIFQERAVSEVAIYESGFD
jgi:hypothetical protein